MERTGGERERLGATPPELLENSTQRCCSEVGSFFFLCRFPRSPPAERHRRSVSCEPSKWNWETKQQFEPH